MQESVNVDVECRTCGRVGGPIVACDICHGNAGEQSRAYTRTEENQGKGGDANRYSRTGNVSPKIISLPGSFAPDQR